MLCFLNDAATTDIYTLSLHDALPIFRVAEVGRLELADRRHEPVEQPARLVGEERQALALACRAQPGQVGDRGRQQHRASDRSEEHTSELQSQFHLVCRLLLEKKKTKT